jgi:hypothetical protein
VAKDVPSSLAFAVARNSPQLKYLHVNYDDNNNTYMEQLEAFCFELEEVKLRGMKPLARLDKDNEKVVVELAQFNGSYEFSIFCESARLNSDDWHRDSSMGRKFSWKRFLYSMALIQAILFNQTELAKPLIESDVCNVAAVVAVSNNGWTALIWATYNGNAELVRLLLQKDASNVDAQPIRGHSRTALMWASWYGHVDIVELLIRSGANLDLKDRDNRTAFDILFLYGNHLSQEEKIHMRALFRIMKQERHQTHI